MWMIWVGAGLTGWFVLSVLVGLSLGAMVRMRDLRPTPASAALRACDVCLDDAPRAASPRFAAVTG